MTSARPSAGRTPAGGTVPPPATGRKRPAHSLARRGVVPYLYLLPGLLLFGGLMLYPMFQALLMSFFDWNVRPGVGNTFVGVENFVRAFSDPVFWTALVNTTVYMLLTVPIQMALGMLLAVLLHRKIRGRVAFRTLFYLPVITSWVVVSLLFKYLFNSQAGFVNYVLVDVLGVLDANVAWLQNRWTALITIGLLGIWKGVGWSMLIFLAALNDVPQDLQEAAMLDGASPLQRFRHVTVPVLRPIIAFVTIMLVIGGFNVFISVFLVTGGGPSNQTEVLLTYMYDQAFSFLDFGYGAAIAFILTVIIFGLSTVQMRWFRYGEDT